MLELVLIRGLPGSGKTTLAQRLLEPLDAVHLEADMFWGPDYAFDLSRLREAHEWCLDETARHLSEGTSVVVSNTFTRLWEMQTYVALAVYLSARLTVIHCEGRHGSVHGVPPEVVERMAARWEPYDGDVTKVLQASEPQVAREASDKADDRP